MKYSPTHKHEKLMELTQEMITEVLNFLQAEGKSVVDTGQLNTLIAERTEYKQDLLTCREISLEFFNEFKEFFPEREKLDIMSIAKIVPGLLKKMPTWIPANKEKFKYLKQIFEKYDTTKEGPRTAAQIAAHTEEING